MKRSWLLILTGSLLLHSCGPKQKVEDKKFISIISLIRKQVAHVDTSLYSIMKVVYTDSLHSDTSYIPREDFEKTAKDFLDIPDLSDRKVAKRYKEEPARFDEMLNRVIITYLPLDPGKEEIKRQELLATPVPGEESKINNIIIIREINNRDSFLQKKMLWQMDKSFQVVTSSQKPGKPEIVTTTKVSWNEDAQ
ncbi:MAG: hypothetical protein ABIR30_10150 [Chitinophagaceae bacterium]